jgi:membrane fusion protein (multidrug efflux system)
VGVSRVLARFVTPAVCGFALAGCGAQATPKTEDARPAESLLRVDTATIEVALTLPAQLYVEHDAAVYARAGGIVDSVYVDLGSRVAQGDRLAELEHVDQELALAQADRAYTGARQDVERMRRLMQSRGLTVADSERAEFAYDQAALTRRQAQRSYDLTRVVAPFDGVVTARMIRPGRLVVAGDSLFRVSALGPLRASVRVPEGSAGNISIGSRTQVFGADSTPASATVIRTSPTIDAASGTREVVIELASGSHLMPGTSVTVRVGTERRRVVTVPVEAVSAQGYVLVWENDRAVLRPVATGPRLRDGRVEIRSGLSGGELIVRNPR